MANIKLELRSAIKHSSCMYERLSVVSHVVPVLHVQSDGAHRYHRLCSRLLQGPVLVRNLKHT